LSLKANIRAQRESVPGGGDDERYLLLFDVENDGEQDATDFRLDVEFPGWFLDGSGYSIQRGEARPGFTLFQISNKSCPKPIEHLYPGTRTPSIISFYGAVHGIVKRERPDQLRDTVTASVYSGNMKPRVTSKTIADLMRLANSH